MLNRLLAPVSPGRFFEHMWSQRAVYLPADYVRFDDILPPEGWQALLTHATHIESTDADVHGRQRHYRIDLAHAKAALAAGQTVCADVSSAPAIASRLEALHEALRSHGGHGRAVLHVSPPGAGAPVHFDADHAFVVQLAGAKHWWYAQTPALPHAPWGAEPGSNGVAIHTAPRAGTTVVDDAGAPIRVPDRTTLESSLLGPGDVLYIPPGTWHASEASAISVALSLTPARTPTYALLTETIGAQLQEDRSLWQDAIAPVLDDASGEPHALIAATRNAAHRLRAASGALTDGTVRLHWAREIFADERAPAIAVPALSPLTKLHHAPGGFCVLRGPGTDGADAIHLFRPGAELELPADVSTDAFVDALTARARFLADDACKFAPALSQDEVYGLLAGLIGAGLLCVDEDRER